MPGSRVGPNEITRATAEEASPSHQTNGALQFEERQARWVEVSARTIAHADGAVNDTVRAAGRTGFGVVWLAHVCGSD